jgi:hypothetical protein
MKSLGFRGRVPNALVLLTGADRPEIPDAFDGRSTIATASCVAVVASAESEVCIRFISVDADLWGLPSHLVFEGTLPVTNGRLACVNVLGEELVSIEVQSPELGLRLFVDNLAEPTEIVVVVSGSST